MDFNFFYSANNFHLTEIQDLKKFVDEYVRSPHWDNAGLTIKVAEKEDFENLLKQIKKFKNSTRIIDRINRGDICFVVYKENRLAHFNWAALIALEIPELEKVLYLNSSEAYTYDSYTLPEFRREGITSEAMRFRTNYLAQKGIKIIYAINKIDNIRVQSNVEKLQRIGIRRIMGTIKTIQIFGLKHYRFYGELEEDRQKMARLFCIWPKKITLCH